MNQVESRPLRYFVAVAEELNFARAAERLGIASPALSRAIALLEAQLGVSLFERSTRHVELTDAGRVLLDQARPALQSLDAAARRAQRATGPRHRLVLTLKADLEGGLLESILEAYRGEPEAIPIEVSFSAWGHQAQLVRDGRADVALHHATAEAADLDSELLLEEQRLAVLAAAHPLAAKDELSMAAVEAGHEPSASGQLWWDPRSAGPPEIEDLGQMLQRIELGDLIALLPASVVDRYPRPQLAARPVKDLPPARLVVSWPRTATSTAIAAFIRASTDVAARRAR